MRKRLIKFIWVWIFCMLLSVNALAINTDAPLTTGRLSETVTLTDSFLVDSDGNLITVIATVDDIFEEDDETGGSFTTDFILKILPEVTPYEEGVVSLGGGIGGVGDRGGLGAWVAEKGMDFDPPLIAALICGGGYLICAGLANYAGIGKRSRTEKGRQSF